MTKYNLDSLLFSSLMVCMMKLFRDVRTNYTSNTSNQLFIISLKEVMALFYCLDHREAERLSLLKEDKDRREVLSPEPLMKSFNSPKIKMLIIENWIRRLHSSTLPPAQSNPRTASYSSNCPFTWWHPIKSLISFPKTKEIQLLKARTTEIRHPTYNTTSISNRTL